MNKLYLLLFFILTFQQFNYAQTRNGAWMLGGVLETNTQTVNGSPRTDILLNPQAGLVFGNNWMAEAELLIQIRNKWARVGHGLSLRNFFMRTPQNEVYASLFYFKENARSLLPTGPNNRFNILSAGPGAGVIHYFNSTCAMEVGLKYHVYWKTVNPFNPNTRNGNFQVIGTMKFLFDSRLPQDSSQYEYKTVKNTWVVGGEMTLGSQNLFDGFYSSNNLAPYAGYFITDHFMLGSGLNFNNDTFFERFTLGLAPFGRYYVQIGRKHQLFAELNGYYNISWERDAEDGYDRDKHSRSMGGALGLSSGISAQVSFDMMMGFQKDEWYDRYAKYWRSQERIIFCIALQAFIQNEDKKD